MQVRVLGSIEVTRDGQAIRLAGQGQRAVLGALALEQGRPVSVERLAEAIWQLSPPATSRTKIQAIRLRVENQLGYKMVKWIERIEFLSLRKRLG